MKLQYNIVNKANFYKKKIASTRNLEKVLTHSLLQEIVDIFHKCMRPPNIEFDLDLCRLDILL